MACAGGPGHPAADCADACVGGPSIPLRTAPMPAARVASVRYTNRPAALARGEERLPAWAPAGHRECCPEVTVRQEVVGGGAREALIAASRFPRLMAVGARGRGGFAGLLPGPVSQAVPHDAHGPVAVVRGTDERHRRTADAGPWDAVGPCLGRATAGRVGANRVRTGPQTARSIT